MKRVAIALLLLALLQSCARDITDYYNPEADFSNYTTFYWDAPLNKAFKKRLHPVVDKSIVNKQIKENVEVQMAGLGYRKKEYKPELLINFHVMVENKSNVNSSYPNSYNFRWRNDNQTINYKKGTLIIDIIDANNDQLVWQGHSTVSISSEEIIQSINEAVLKIFSQYKYRAERAPAI